jgi:hypothetical protein
MVSSSRCVARLHAPDDRLDPHILVRRQTMRLHRIVSPFLPDDAGTWQAQQDVKNLILH